MFYKNNYTESLDHISKIKYETLPITIDIYILKLKIFYIPEYYDSVLSALSPYFLTKEKFPADKKLP